ncbi:helicase-exonuclease AddAB subunit AddA [Streptococcus cameli]
MVNKPFLTEDQIQERITQEKASDKVQKMTPEQLTAIYSNGRNILVSASAGSGKTFVMVERIVDMIGRGVGIDELFISTFTVKAAGELKERLEKRLTKALSEAETDEDRQHFSDQIAGIQTADIGTMDAFTQKLVNQYGYLIGVSPIFRILTDESEQQILKKEVYEDLFRDYMNGDQKELFTSLVRNFSGHRKDSQAFRQIVYNIHNFSQSTAGPKEWLETIFLSSYQGPQKEQEQLFLQSILSGQSLQSLVDEAIDYFKRHLETVRNEFQKSYKYLDNVDSLLEILETYQEGQDVEALYEFATEVTRAAAGRNLVMAVGSTKDETIKSFASDYNKERNLYILPFKKLQAAILTLLALKPHEDKILPMLELLRKFVLDFSHQYLQVKMQENAFEFNDIAHFAIEILEENPTVASLFKQKYHEVMVDEYQDNNHMQERMLELLSNGHNRFMVGDIKQSIYRFRQADPQIFNQKFKRYQEFPEDGQLILLKENFRSQSEVLDATNGVFAHLMDEKVGDILYDTTHLLVVGSPKQKEGHKEYETEVLIFNTEQEESTSEADEELPVSRGEIDLVAKEIIRLHNEQGVSFSEITLLVSSRTRNEPLIAAFEEYGIPVESDGGEKNYLKSLEVMIMLDTLRVIDNPLNDYALVALLRSPMFHFDEDQLARLAIQAKEGELYDKLLLVLEQTGAHPELVSVELYEKLSRFMAYLSDWRQFAKSHSLYDLIWKIYRDRFYYDYVAALPKPDQRQANLYALALRANNFEKSGFKGLARFIHMIDKVLETDTDLMEVVVGAPKNAVKLMTIHHSKGLEFPYVFVLNADKKFSMQDSHASMILSRDNGIGIKYLADMKEQVNTVLPHLPVSIETVPYQLNRRELNLATLSEQMRLLYVAMTRAEKKLYIIGKGQKEKLSQKFDGAKEDHHLPATLREEMQSFQDWLVAIWTAFPHQELAYQLRYVEAEELTADKIGCLQGRIDKGNVKHNRQSADIRRALDVLESVEKVNKEYKAAIELPTVRTPSQIKAFYEPIMDSEGLDIMDKPVLYREQSKSKFVLPEIGSLETVSGMAVGSATHEFMQRLPLSGQVTRAVLEETLESVQASPSVKAALQLDKILAFFDTDLGQLIIQNLDKLYREAPFAMLEKDPTSQEDFVVRGIVDGYLVFEDRIVLFDYKTDSYTNPETLRERYQFQMELYAKALQKSYGIARIDKYLILLGGKEIEVLAL